MFVDYRTSSFTDEKTIECSLCFGPDLTPVVVTVGRRHTWLHRRQYDKCVPSFVLS